MRPVKAVLLALGVSGLALGTARADVKPHPIFSDNMVLQQGGEVRVWGKADPGEKVTVGLGKAVAAVAPATVSAVADKDGKWSVTLPKQAAGTGYMLAVRGKNAVLFKNVAVGEVWVCSGQSNMEWPVNAGEDPAKVKAGAKNPDLRLFTVQKRTAAHPIEDQNDLKHFTKWIESAPEVVGGFSAVAYHFGQKLQKELGVPVGLIHTSWGGTVCEAWTSLEALDAEPSLKYLADRARAATVQYGKTKRAVGPNTPTALYNAMIYPLLNFKVKGAIWYQGESNNTRAYEYRTLLPTMIQDWRKRFDCDLPFMVVQLAPFGNGNASAVTYAELRDAQLHASQKLPKVGLAVITDVGNEKNIHPIPKQPVGERLALPALFMGYDKKIVYSGPVLKEAMFRGETATLTFDHIGGGLVAKGSSGGEVVGFMATGADSVFHPAKAIIKGETIVISSPDVKDIKAVRYGWVNFAKPTLNLFNKEGLPASPFRTDSLPLTTQPKKK